MTKMLDLIHTAWTHTQRKERASRFAHSSKVAYLSSAGGFSQLAFLQREELAQRACSERIARRAIDAAEALKGPLESYHGREWEFTPEQQYLTAAYLIALDLVVGEVMDESLPALKLGKQESSSLRKVGAHQYAFDTLIDRVRNEIPLPNLSFRISVPGILNMGTGPRRPPTPGELTIGLQRFFGSRMRNQFSIPLSVLVIDAVPYRWHLTFAKLAIENLLRRDRWTPMPGLQIAGDEDLQLKCWQSLWTYAHNIQESETVR